MRKVTYGGGCSLDGFVAGRDGALDWLHFSKDAEAVMKKTWASTDTILMGRKTWEGAVAQGGDGGGMPGVKAYVFSRTLTQIPGKGGGARDERRRRLRPRLETAARQGHRRHERRPFRDVVVGRGRNRRGRAQHSSGPSGSRCTGIFGSGHQGRPRAHGVSRNGWRLRAGDLPRQTLTSSQVPRQREACDGDDLADRPRAALSIQHAWPQRPDGRGTAHD